MSELYDSDLYRAYFALLQKNDLFYAADRRMWATKFTEIALEFGATESAIEAKGEEA